MSEDLNNQEKLEAIYKMTIENNDILRTIRRQQYFANALRVIYWLVVIGALGGTYFLVKPFISAFAGGNTGNIESAYSQLRNQLPETKVIEQIINGIKNATNTDVQMPDNGVVDQASSTVR